MRLLHAGARGVVGFFTQTAHRSAKKHEANRIRLRGACNDAGDMRRCKLQQLTQEGSHVVPCWAALILVFGKPPAWRFRVTAC